MVVIAVGRELAVLAAEAVVLVAKDAGVGRAELGVVVLVWGWGRRYHCTTLGLRASPPVLAREHGLLNR